MHVGHDVRTLPTGSTARYNRHRKAHFIAEFYSSARGIRPSPMIMN